MYQFYIFQTLQRSENYYYELLTCNDTKNRVKLKCVCFIFREGRGAFDIHSNVPKSMAIEKMESKNVCAVIEKQSSGFPNVSILMHCWLK